MSLRLRVIAVVLSVLLVPRTVLYAEENPPPSSENVGPIVTYVNAWPGYDVDAESAAAYVDDTVGDVTNDLEGIGFSCSGADCCSDGGCRRWQYRAGIEATFLAPQIHDDPIAVTFNDLIASTSTVVLSDAADAEYLGAAPRITFGLQRRCSCWGIQARYWAMTNAAIASDPFNPIAFPGDTIGFQASSVFEAHTVDLEVTRRGCFREWNTLLSMGARHAAIERSETLAVSAVDSGVVLYALSGLAERQFNGTGVTVALRGAKPFRHCCGLGMFWNVRGSYLWGDNQMAHVTNSANGAGDSSFDGSWATISDELFIGEIQLGLEWERELECVNSSMFVNAAIEYQYWTADQGGGAATSGAGVTGQSNATLVAMNRELDMSLVGFTLGIGFAR